MSKILIVPEKPSAAKTIAAALGGFSRVENWLESDRLIIAPAIGHLVTVTVASAATVPRGLPGLPIIPEAFDLSVIEATKAQFATIKKLMKRADVTAVVNACDAGREGELIFRLIYEHAGCRKPMQRMWFQSMTAESLQASFENRMPGSAYDNLGDAARCRTEADWLVGINGTRAITGLIERLAPSLGPCNAGRVLTPTTAFIVDREYQIRRFAPKDYWEVHAHFAISSGTYASKWVGGQAAPEADAADPDSDPDAVAGTRFFDVQQAQALVNKCRGVEPSAVSERSEQTKSAPPRLYDLTALQREANRKFKFSAQKTLDIAQALYEKHQVITYPRTEATALPEDFGPTVIAVLESLSNSDYRNHAWRVLTNEWVQTTNKAVFNDKKITDHWAIIPEAKLPSELSAEEHKIYDLIVSRFLSVFHPPAIYNKTTRTTVVAGETFMAKGKTLVQRGWLEVYGLPGPTDSNSAICPLAPGEQAYNQAVEIKASQTKPPKRYTADTLLGAMESAGRFVENDEQRDALKARGLGTTATRAPTLEAILSDQDGGGRTKEPYARLEGSEGYFVPTAKAMKLIPFCREIGIGDLTLPEMTGDWEMKLRLMERGDYPRSAFMEEIAVWTGAMVTAIKSKLETLPALAQRTLKAACPCCQAPVLALARTFECQKSCGFTIWRELVGRVLTDAEAEQLIGSGSIKQLDGFVSRAKNKFSAGVRLNGEFKAELVFEEREEAAGQQQTLPVQCPKCGGAVLVTGGQYAKYACKAQDFVVWKVTAGRTMSDSEVISLIRDGQLPAMSGFKGSKAKSKPFSAGLRLSADKSKVDLVFNEPR